MTFLTVYGVTMKFLELFLLQVYLYIYSLLRGVTFKIPSFSSCALSPMVVPLLEIFLELLLWKSLQYHHIFLTS